MGKKFDKVDILFVCSLTRDKVEKGTEIIKNFFGEELGEKFLNLIDRMYFQDENVQLKYPLFVEITPKEWLYYKRKRLHHNARAGQEWVVDFYKQRRVLFFLNFTDVLDYITEFLRFWDKILKKKKSIEDSDEWVIILRRILYEMFIAPPNDYKKFRNNWTKKQKSFAWKEFFNSIIKSILISLLITLSIIWMDIVPNPSIPLIFGVPLVPCLYFGILGGMYSYDGFKNNCALENMRSEYLEKAGCAFSLSDDVGLSLLRNHIKQRKSFGLVLSPEERELLLEIAEAQCQSEKFDIEMNLTYKPFVLRKIYYGFKKWCLDPNTKGDAFFRINTKWKVEFFKEMLLRGLYERGFTGGIMSISGRLYIRDEGKYEISNDYTLTPEGKMLISMLNRLYE